MILLSSSRGLSSDQRHHYALIRRSWAGRWGYAGLSARNKPSRVDEKTFSVVFAIDQAATMSHFVLLRSSKITVSPREYGITIESPRTSVQTSAILRITGTTIA